MKKVTGRRSSSSCPPAKANPSPPSVRARPARREHHGASARFNARTASSRKGSSSPSSPSTRPFVHAHPRTPPNSGAPSRRLRPPRSARNRLGLGETEQGPGRQDHLGAAARDRAGEDRRYERGQRRATATTLAAPAGRWASTSSDCRLRTDDGQGSSQTHSEIARFFGFAHLVRFDVDPAPRRLRGQGPFSERGAGPSQSPVRNHLLLGDAGGDGVGGRHPRFPGAAPGGTRTKAEGAMQTGQAKGRGSRPSIVTAAIPSVNLRSRARRRVRQIRRSVDIADPV